VFPTCFLFGRTELLSYLFADNIVALPAAISTTARVVNIVVSGRSMGSVGLVGTLRDEVCGTFISAAGRPEIPWIERPQFCGLYTVSVTPPPEL
jgi:hypothetical protein